VITGFNNQSSTVIHYDETVVTKEKFAIAGILTVSGLHAVAGFTVVSPLLAFTSIPVVADFTAFTGFTAAQASLLSGKSMNQ
jgi:hypothetical protein